MADTVEVVILGKDQASGAFRDVEQSARGLSGALGAGVKGAAAVGGAAVAGIATAAVGAGAAAVGAFVPFEDAMSEVFTLLPGISSEAMASMQGDVLNFSREFGTLPQDVIPALYQALSAGVPPDNVFDFLGTAQQAATGGVTELTTAVDGISSVVNAYGSELMGATDASDLMFTAVRLGKTNMDQLSSSLFQVTPTAAGLGVGFDQVTASLASLTSQGVPTRVASTQLRQLMIELSEEGGKAAKTFESMSGQTFAEFVASGGNVADALKIMQGAAAEGGVGIQDLFGSVEAGSAALSLTSDNLDGLRSNLAEMEASSGATATAFETRADTTQRSWEQIKATVAAGLIEVGGGLSPLIDLVSGFVQEHLPSLIEGVSGFAANLSQFFGAFTDSFDDSGDLIGSLVVGFQSLVGPTSELGTAALDTGQFLRDIWQVMTDFVAQIVEFAEPIIALVTNFVSWQDVLAGLAVVVGAAVLPIIASLIGSILAIAAPVAAIIGAIALLRAAWQSDWGGIRTALTDAWAAVQPKLELARTWLIENLPAALETLRGLWESAWQLIESAVELAIETVKTIWQAFRLFFEGDFDALGALLKEKWEDIWNSIKIFITEILPAITDELRKFWADYVKPWLEGFWQSFKTWWGNLTEALKGIGRSIIDGLLAGLKAQADAVRSWITGFVGDIIAAVKALFGISSPSKVMREIGRDLTEGLRIGIEQWKDDPISAAEQMGLSIVDALAASLEGVEDAVEAAFDIGGELGSFASSFGNFFQSQQMDPIAEQIDSLASSAQSILGGVFSERWAESLMGDSFPQQRARLLMMLNDPRFDVTQKDAIRTALEMLERRNELEQQHMQMQQEQLRLSELQQQASFLEAQMDLINFVNENELSPSLLQGLQLGPNASASAIFEAMSAAYAQWIERMSGDVFVAGGGSTTDQQSPSDRMTFNIDARGADAGVEQRIRRGIDMALQQAARRGDIRTRAA